MDENSLDTSGNLLVFGMLIMERFPTHCWYFLPIVFIDRLVQDL